MIDLQFDLFEDLPDEISVLRKELYVLKESQDKLRKCLFARDNGNNKDRLKDKEEIQRLRFELDTLKKMISK